MEWIWIFPIVALIVWWLIRSLKIVGPDEMGVKVIFGSPVGFCDSGFHFVPFLPACFLKRYPKRLYNLVYPTRRIVSSEGEFEHRQYGAQVLQVDSVAYLRFPRNEKLIEVLRSGVPIEDVDLKDWTEEAVVGALRIVLGRITWKQATERMAGVIRAVDEISKAKDGTLLRAGFREEDIRLTIKEIRLPPELEKLLPEVDRQRLEAEAAPFEAHQIAVETVGAIVQMMAESRGVPVKTIQDQIKADPALQREFLDRANDLVVRRMGIDGKSYVDIRVQGAEGIERTILNALAVWQRMPGGGTKKTPGGETKETVADKPSRRTRELPPELTKEEEKEIEEWLEEDEEDGESI